MSWIIPDQFHRFKNGMLNHHGRRADVTASARIDVIVWRQIIEGKCGYIADALFATAETVAFIP